MAIKLSKFNQKSIGDAFVNFIINNSAQKRGIKVKWPVSAQRALKESRKIFNILSVRASRSSVR